MSRRDSPSRPLFALLLSVCALGGCATRPSVTYTRITPQTDVTKLTDSFICRLPRLRSRAPTRRSLERMPRAGRSQSDLHADGVPGLQGRNHRHSSWRGSVNTVVNITKIDNTGW